MKSLGPDPEHILSALAAVPADSGPAALAAGLREADARLVAAVKAGAAGRWFPGKGGLLGRILADIKEAVVRKALEPVGRDGRGTAIVALGGLGRRELAPGSDLDLLILHAPGTSVEAFVRVFLQTLWDAGFEVTASTRTVADCLSHAAEDETFFTALFTARLLTGDRDLFARLGRRFARTVRARGRALAADWLEETRETANGTADGRTPLLAKEPNLKKAPGGLRAVHQIEWAIAIAQGLPGLPDLSRSLPADDFRRLQAARDFILYLRIMLHFELGGKENTLALDYQLPVADTLGLACDEIERIRTMMRFYYGKIATVHRILFRCLENVWIDTRPLLRARLSRLGPARSKPEKAMFTAGGVLYAGAGLDRSPRAAFDLLERLARERMSFSSSVAAYLAACARTAKEEEWQPVVRQRLVTLLALDFSSQSLKAMLYAGLFDLVLPVMRPVRHFFLYSPAHLFPVDLHSLEALNALERLAAGELSGTADRLIEPVRDVAASYREKLWALKLALVLHDAGKGSPGDHVKNGVDLAARFLPVLGVVGQIKAAILFIIEHHLVLSATARHRDTADPGVIEDLAGIFVLSPYPEEYLDLLYMFTFADVRATNPKYFHGYFALTLTRLYQKVREIVLSGPRGRALPPEAAPGDGDARADATEVEAFAADLGERYLEHNTETAVSRDFEILSSLAPDGFSLQAHAGSEYLRVKFYAGDQPGLFALLAGILSLNGATIVRADIHTWRGRVLDEFFITRLFESDAGELSDASDVARLKAALEKGYAAYRDDLSGLSERLECLKRATKGLGARFTHPAGVTITPRGEDDARIEIAGRDRPALLFDLAWALTREGVDVRSAFIDTSGWYAQDVLEVRFASGADKERVDGVTRTLLKIMEGS
ncbi:MAG: HD domain-containing protein [Spirochaetales bacterium]|nr:HD domain-containing protein [Spirochaetales bacterium]